MTTNNKDDIFMWGFARFTEKDLADCARIFSTFYIGAGVVLLGASIFINEVFALWEVMEAAVSVFLLVIGGITYRLINNLRNPQTKKFVDFWITVGFALVGTNIMLFLGDLGSVVIFTIFCVFSFVIIWISHWRKIWSDAADHSAEEFP